MDNQKPEEKQESEKKKVVFRISRRLATIDFLVGVVLLFLGVRSALRAFTALQAVGFSFSVLMGFLAFFLLGGVGIILLGRVPPRLVKANLEDMEKAREKEAADQAREAAEEEARLQRKAAAEAAKAAKEQDQTE